MQNSRDPYYPRASRTCLLRASEQFPVVLLTGARQVGKTTFLRHICEERRRYVTLDDPALRALASEDPGLFVQRYAPPVLIDEIQYAPQLLPLIKMHVDAKQDTGLFWLTGSQQFQMMKGVSETLAGRVAIINLLGFSNRERHRLEFRPTPFLPTQETLTAGEPTSPRRTVQEVFKDIWLGSFPALIAGPVRDRDLFYSSYLQTYLQRDLRDLAQVGNESAFLRFLKTCAARTGQMLNYADLARDADVSVNTAKSWISVLQASCQVHLLNPYHSNITKRLVKRPKLYFLDTGLCAYLTEWSTPETLSSGAMSGAIFETYVFGEILRSWWHLGRSPQLYYYRDRDTREIDLLLHLDGVIYPLEIKKAVTPKRDWTRPFSALKKLQQNVGPGGIICLCEELLPLGSNVNAIPFEMI